MQDVENFAKKTSWQIAKILELPALDHPSYPTSIPTKFDRTISTLPVYYFIKYLEFVFLLRYSSVKMVNFQVFYREFLVQKA